MLNRNKKRQEAAVLSYVLLFLTIALLSVIEVFSIDSEKSLPKRDVLFRVIVIVIIISLIVFAGTRDELGTDYNTYSRYYDSVKHDSVSFTNVEPIFILLVKMMPSFEGLLLCVAVIAIGVKGKFFYEKSPYVFVSILVYYSYAFLQFDMGIIRQGLALSFTLWAASYAGKNQKLFLLYAVIAIICHYSALLFFFAYYFALKEYKKTVMYGLAVLAIFLSFTGFWQIISVGLDALSALGLSKYSWYMENSQYRAPAFELLDLQRAAMLVFFVETIGNAPSKEDRIFLNYYFFGTILYYLFRSFSAISSRGCYYFVIMEVILFPKALKKIDKPLIRVLAVLLLVVYCGIYIFKVLNQYPIPDYHNLPFIPYNSWLFS